MNGKRLGLRLGCNGYLTVYLTLILAVLVSLYLVLLEGVRSNGIRLQVECVTDIALNSVLAEYHRELYRQYNLFAIDTSYGTQQSGRRNVEQHLLNYLNRNFSMDGIFLSNFLYRDFFAVTAESAMLTKVSVMTDGHGTVFRRRAVDAIENDVGLEGLEKLTEWMKQVEENGLNKRDISLEKARFDEQIDSYDGLEKQISEKEWITIDIDNPTQGLEAVRSRGILNLVLSRPDEISENSVFMDELIGARAINDQINSGNFTSTDISGGEELAERFFFQEYLLRYMGHWGYEDNENALLYQIEYLIAGENSDAANLKETVNRLCTVREAANVVHLYSDEKKCAEAEAAGTLLAIAMHVPEISSLLKHSLLLGWAYAESLYDVKILLEGGRIPLIKDSASWHYDLDSALQMRNTSEDCTKGLSYEDYLRVLLTLTDYETLTMRAMNMVEADIRLSPGNCYFRLDACYDQIEAAIDVKSDYGYRYEITRMKKY